VLSVVVTIFPGVTTTRAPPITALEESDTVPLIEAFGDSAKSVPMKHPASNANAMESRRRRCSITASKAKYRLRSYDRYTGSIATQPKSNLRGRVRGPAFHPKFTGVGIDCDHAGLGG
jgi:hypothetical protein